MTIILTEEERTVIRWLWQQKRMEVTEKKQGRKWCCEEKMNCTHYLRVYRLYNTLFEPLCVFWEVSLQGMITISKNVSIIHHVQGTELDLEGKTKCKNMSNQKKLDIKVNR